VGANGDFVANGGADIDTSSCTINSNTASNGKTGANGPPGMTGHSNRRGSRDAVGTQSDAFFAHAGPFGETGLLDAADL
jgi:hypothetical protein